MNDIEHQKPKTVLVDNCVLDLAETVQEGTKRVEVPWGDITVTTDIVGLVGKTPRDTTQQAQRECLPTIARLVRNGTLEMSAEELARVFKAGMGRHKKPTTVYVMDNKQPIQHGQVFVYQIIGDGTGGLCLSENAHPWSASSLGSLLPL